MVDLPKVADWIRRAMRFIDLVEADALDYEDTGLTKDAGQLTDDGYALFGLSVDDERTCLAALEHRALASPAGCTEDRTRPLEGVEPDELTESALLDRAKAMMKHYGWKPGDRPGLHSVMQLMVKFGMELSRKPETARCGHPDCGCDFDAVCDAALSPSPARLVEAAQAVLDGACRPGARMVFGSDEDCWENYEEVPQSALEALQAALSPSPEAQPEPVDAGYAAALVYRLWGQIYDQRPAGDPKDTLRQIMAALKASPPGSLLSVRVGGGEEKEGSARTAPLGGAA